MSQALPLFDRIDRFVEREPMSGCWLWIGYRNPTSGYGMIHLRARSYYVHRVVYELYRSREIQDPLTLDHLCRTPACVNPAHMEEVTIKVNILRGEGLAARNARKTHCMRGHEFIPTNIIWTRTGRTCRTCQLLYLKAWNMAKALGYYKCANITN